MSDRKGRQVVHFKRHQCFRGLTFCSFLFLVALSLEEDHGQAINIREEETLPIYKEKLREHSFTATIYNNISNNFCTLGEFDQAKLYSEHALEIRRKLLNDHMPLQSPCLTLGWCIKKRGTSSRQLLTLNKAKTCRRSF